jgi:hypothetical protein
MALTQGNTPKWLTRSIGGVRIEACRAEDLERLEEAIPSWPSRFHEHRFARQEQGR